MDHEDYRDLELLGLWPAAVTIDGRRYPQNQTQTGENEDE